jgi:hypothetical protein
MQFRQCRGIAFVLHMEVSLGVVNPVQHMFGRAGGVSANVALPGGAAENCT